MVPSIESLNIKSMFYKLWFSKKTQSIVIVVSPEEDKPQDANIYSRNYGFMDNVGDKDAILEIVKLLSKKYPKAELDIRSADTYEPSYKNLRKNIVVIGGPGGSEYEMLDGTLVDDCGNKICREFGKKINSKVSYSNDCETMIVDDNKYKAQYESDGIMEADYGYFCAMPNPFNHESRVILIHGIHTLGVVGAAIAFSDDSIAESNFQILNELFSKETKNEIMFETFFNVAVHKGQAFCPTINAKDIFIQNQVNNLVKSNELIKQNKKIDEEDRAQEYSNNVDELKFLIEKLWEEMAREVPAYKRNAPENYKVFTEDKNNLNVILNKLNPSDNTGVDQVEDYKSQYNVISMRWRGRKRL